MTAIKVPISKFSGASKVFSREPDALAAIIRGLAIDNARTALEKSVVAQLTDNSTGAAVLNASAYVTTPAPAAAIDATSAGGAQTTALTTSLGKIDNAYQVLTQSVNGALGRLGLKPIVNAYGTQASANTIPAQDVAGAAASGASAVSYASAVAAFNALDAKFTELAFKVNEVLVAVGAPAV